MSGKETCIKPYMAKKVVRELMQDDVTFSKDAVSLLAKVVSEFVVECGNLTYDHASWTRARPIGQVEEDVMDLGSIKASQGWSAMREQREVDSAFEFLFEWPEMFVWGDTDELAGNGGGSGAVQQRLVQFLPTGASLKSARKRRRVTSVEESSSMMKAGNGAKPMRQSSLLLGWRMGSVELRVYDLTRGMATMLAPMMLGMPLDGVWHTGVHVFGKEIFYGGGIQIMTPRRVEAEYGMVPKKVINLGSTRKSEPEMIRFLESVNSKFTEAKYNLVNWNCNHFSEELSKFLLEKDQAIPRDILLQHEVIMKSPLGASILNLLQGMQKEMGDNLRGRGEPSLREQEEAAERNGVAKKSAASVNFGDTKFGAALKTFVSGESESKMIVVDALSSLAKGVLRNPNDEKYRRVRAENPAIQRRILVSPEARNCLIELGFVEKFDSVAGETIYLFPVPAAQDLQTLEVNVRVMVSWKDSQPQ